MKKGIIVIVALMSAMMVNGQVVKGVIGNGNYTLSDGAVIPAYGLDFDSDGNLEFVVSAYFDMNTYEVFANAHLEYRLDLFNNVITNSDEDYMSIKLLERGASVGVQCSFLGEGEAVFSDFGAISDTASYAGFMVKYGESVHYGYAKFHIVGDSISWDEIFYNQSATQAITVGERGAETGVEEAGVESFVAAAMDGGVINVVQGSEGEVRVYDMSGRLVGEGYGDNVNINVGQAGVYVIKSGLATAKIVVR